MSEATHGFELEVIWFDDDLLELRATASNGQFYGQTTFYAALDEAKKFASAIAGFPTSIGDVREYEFGSTGLSGYGGAKIRLSCKDGRGHLTANISIHELSTNNDKNIQSAVVVLCSDPASIDTFVEELRRLQLTVGEKARLSNAT